MARMLPPNIPATTPSGAERDMFARIETNSQMNGLCSTRWV